VDDVSKLTRQRDAKFAIMKEAKEKKQLKKGKVDGVKVEEKPKKKSVGFA
jgi:hypothetical protein